jgi:hypothetical protein
MKKTFSFSIALISISVFSMQACKKENSMNDPVISSENKVRSSTSKYSGMIDPSNEENQYDVIGLIHNEAMAVMANDSFINESTRSGFYLKGIRSIMDKHDISTAQLSLVAEASKNEVNKAIVSIRANQNLSVYISDLYNRGLICSEQKQYLNEMESETGRISVYQKQTKSDFQALQKLISNFKNIEHRIVGSSSLNDNQKQILLCASSVYKYSMTNYFDFIYSKQNAWRGYFDTKGVNNPPGHTTLPEYQLMTWTINGADWAKIGHADAGGAIAGVAGAGASAIFVTITGPIIAAAGLAGGVGASIQELYSQWANGTAHIDWECC